MITKKNTKAAFLTVEAAIFLPIFIISILCIGYFMKFTAAQEIVIHDMTEEAKRASLYQISELTLPVNAAERVEQECSDAENYRTVAFIPSYSANGIDRLCKLSVKYDVNIHLPLDVYDGFSDERSLIFRPFTGSIYTPEAEIEDDDDMVIVFPRYGIRYHKPGCIYIKRDSYIIEIKKTEAIEKGYTPCKVCGG